MKTGYEDLTPCPGLPIILRQNLFQADFASGPGGTLFRGDDPDQIALSCEAGKFLNGSFMFFFLLFLFNIIKQKIIV